MDSLGSLALATEPPSMKLLERMPHERDDYLISKSMWRNILGHALYQFTVLMVVVFPGHLWIPEDSNAVELITGRLRDTQIISLKCVLQKVYGSTDLNLSVYSTAGDGHSFVSTGKDYEYFSDKQIYKEIYNVYTHIKTRLTHTHIYIYIYILICSRIH
eukprot:GHVR01110541.1.p1 GENE.GHVR01110541.1~~GHVR01110541.1.p1  ORF type:complete len:159 (+),score=34.31 GHVR01110541.1:853-1329(+)